MKNHPNRALSQGPVSFPENNFPKENRRSLLALVVCAGTILVLTCIYEFAQNRHPSVSPSSGPIPEVHLKLSPKNLDRLRNIRTMATVYGRKTEQKDKWINAELIESGQRFKVRIKIRGLAPNHWTGQKISLNIKLRKVKKTGKLWRGMRSADLIIPGDRQWFQEAIGAYMSGRMGLIASQADFIKLSINGTYQGPYILLDRMTKELLERNNSPESQIYRPVHMTLPGWGDVGYVSDPRVVYNLPIWENKLSEAPNPDGVNSLFQTVFELLLQEHFSKTPAESNQAYQKLRYFLDMEKIAAYQALVKLLGGHAEQLHNIIVYFDSSTGQFQMMLRDAVYESRNPDRYEWGPVEATWPIITKQLIGHEEFRKFRGEALKKVLLLENDFFDFYDRWWQKNFDVVQNDPLDRDLFAFDAGKRGSPRYVLKRARVVYQENFDLMRSIIKSYPKQKTYEIPIENKRFTSVQIVIKSEGPVGKSSAGKLVIRHDSIRPLILESLSVFLPAPPPGDAGQKGWGITGREGRTVKSGQGETAVTYDMGKTLLPVEKDAEIPIVTPEAQEIRWAARILKDGVPLADSHTLISSSWISDYGMDYAFLEAPSQSILSERSDIRLKTSGSDLLILPGRYRVTQTVTLPKGRRIVFSKGTILEFSPGVSFVTYSPISVRGTAVSPVIFRPSDPEKGWGVFAVLQTNDDHASSDVSGLSISGSKGAVHNGITYTAGLAFFKSDVTIRDSYFHQNGDDDALNVKRSKLEIHGSLFLENPSDAIDGDWISGEISGNLFFKNGGDAVDLSGSRDIKVMHNLILLNGDKGCSIGENTQALIRQNFLAWNAMGVAAKDLSRVQAEENIYDRNKVALNAYQKKPIFGGGTTNSESEVFIANLENSKHDGQSRITIQEERVLTADSAEKLPLSAAEAAQKASAVLRELNIPWAKQIEQWQWPEKMEQWVVDRN